jgi:EAL domain-containing protein (putative c-di-GMP-specific phosphodiesterase class I)/GGDEF domain-containing protein
VIGRVRRTRESRFGAKNFRGKILVLAVCAAIGPALASGATLLGVLPAWAHWIFLFTAFLVSCVALAAIDHALRPLSDAARKLRKTEGFQLVPGSDDLEQLIRAHEELRRKLDSLQHRWTQQHPLTELPTREFLIARMQQDVDDGVDAAMLGVIRLRDYDRLAAFDAAKADHALTLFARKLTAAASSKRPLAQVDRDSFGIWFRGMSTQDVETELKALCYALGSELLVGDLPILPEALASAVRFPDDGRDPSALITRALISLDSSSKVRGGGSADVRTPRPVQAARERFSLEQELRHAIEREQFELHFQPVVDVELGKIVGAEALIRWNHPQAGSISPSRFIPILEDARLTDEIGMWALNAACKAARSWEQHGLQGLRVAVNLSATQLRNPDLVRMVSRTLERHKLSPKALEFELTETAAMEGADRTFKLFGELRAMGISLAIDDFGSGYSSLSYLKNLPFDKLKIDREFVVDVHQRLDSQAICRTLVELARGLRIRLVAEGVEHVEEVDLLRRFGCSLFQGFLFSTPLADAEFLAKASDSGWERSIVDKSIPQDPQLHRLIA